MYNCSDGSANRSIFTNIFFFLFFVLFFVCLLVSLYIKHVCVTRVVNERLSYQIEYLFFIGFTGRANCETAEQSDRQ